MENGRHRDAPNSQMDQEHPAPKRKSIRKSIGDALVTPVRAAKRKIQLPGSPSKSSKPRGGKKKTWQEQLQLPAGVHQDEAIAMLLAKELTMLDF